MAENETETETSEHVHTDVPDACSIHATLAANHRTQMRMTILALVGLWLIMMLIANGPANRAAQGKTVYGAVKPAAAVATATATPTSRIAYANDGSGDYWTVNAAGEFCALCGPGRGGSGRFVYDLTGVTASPAGALGTALVTSADWPVAVSETVAKVVHDGTGRTVDALADKIAVRYVVINSETGATGAVMYAADAVDISPAVAGFLTGERVGSRTLIASPGSGNAKADLYLLDITGSTTLVTPTPSPTCTGGLGMCTVADACTVPITCTITGTGGGGGIEHGNGMGVVSGGSGAIADHDVTTSGSGKVYSGTTAR